MLSRLRELCWDRNERTTKPVVVSLVSTFESAFRETPAGAMKEGSPKGFPSFFGVADWSSKPGPTAGSLIGASMFISKNEASKNPP